MDTLAQLIDRREPVQADCPCETVLERFIRDPSALALAVVDARMPVGVIPREAFLARMEVPGSGDLAARAVMSAPPVVLSADTPVDAAVRKLLVDGPEALLGGFIAVDADGGYAGVCTAVALLRARAIAPTAAAGPAEASLVSLIAAEARDPIDGALAAVERLRRFRLPDDAEACLDTVAEAAITVRALLETAGELERSDAESPPFDLAPRRLQDLMDEVEANWRDPAEKAGVMLMVSYDGDPECAALADKPRLMQVFDALIAHALANVRHGVIEASLKTALTEAGVSVKGRVRDNGAQYEPDYLARLFERRRVADGQAGLGLILGLGLASRTIVALGGSIAAEANVGAGATMAFEVTLPSADGEAPAAASDEVAGGRSAHILVVDDNATNRMVVEALCEMFDCSTESVCDGVEAVEAVSTGRYDVILMDIKMPRMDGVTATREIRKLKGEAGRAPIIALTANADPDEVREYLAAGMQGVVEKPIKPERLLEALDAALALRPADESDTAAAAAA